VRTTRAISFTVFKRLVTVGYCGFFQAIFLRGRQLVICRCPSCACR